MEESLLSILAVAFLLGVKHAAEPDHVIAVSTVASQTKRVWNACLAGVFWGIGHTATLFFVGMALIVMKWNMPEKWALSFEFLVGVMIVYLGLSSFFSYRKRNIHAHPHTHGDWMHTHFHSHEHSDAHDHPHVRVSYVKSLVIGCVHGLAGSAGLVLLTMATVQSAAQGALYILVFGAGTVLGMLLCSAAIGLPFALSGQRAGGRRVLAQVVGASSAAFGIYYMYTVGVTGGLFRIWWSQA